MKRLLLYCSLLCVALSACVGPINESTPLPKTAKNFSESMRWKDFETASLYIAPGVRAAFLEQFVEDDDLHIVESQVLKMSPGQEGRTEVEYQMQYYRLPSGSIKKWRWTQFWKLNQEKMTKPGLWLIENAPPRLPWNE